MARQQGRTADGQEEMWSRPSRGRRFHRGGPLSDGTVAGTVVTCPWHGWQFDVPTGACVQDPTVGVTRDDVRVVDEEIQVALTD